MRQSIKVADYLSANEIKTRLQMRGGFFRVQKWLVIYNAIVDPRPLSQIAMHTGLSEGTVLRIIADYNSFGPEFFEDRTKSAIPGGRTKEHRRSMFM